MPKKTSLIAISSLLCLGFADQQVVLANSKTNSLPSQNQQLSQSTPETSQLKNNIKPFKLQPRVSVWGFSGDNTLAAGQAMVPIYGDQSRSLYIAAESSYADKDRNWMFGTGLGYRQVVADRIWGGYTLLDYFYSQENVFPVINPGVEMLGNLWSLSANGYFPIHAQRKKGKLGWAGDDFANYSYGRPTGHDFYDHKLQQYEEIGRGFDVQIGRVIPYIENAKLYLGGYHFDTPSCGAINGISSKLTYALNKYSSIELKDSYDNFNHNQLLVGVRFSLGDYSSEEKQLYGIATRLTDPIEHVISSSGLTIMKKFIDQGEQKEHDNVWYFKPTPPDAATVNPTTGDGTYENPFVGFTPSNYDAISPHIGVIDQDPLMYFAPGSYSFSGFYSRDINDRFNLPNGWGMYGRTGDYKAPAQGQARATFLGGLDTDYSEDTNSGQKATTIDSISIKNYSTPSPSANEEDEGYGYAALYANNASNLILKNTNLEAYGYGITTINSVLNFDGGFNTVTAIANNASKTNVSYGIYARSSTVNFNGGVNTIVSVADNPDNKTNKGYGVNAISSTVNFNGGINTINASSINTGEDESAVYAYGILANNSLINFNEGVNTVNSSAIDECLNKSDSFSYGINIDNSTVNFNHGINTINSTGSKTDKLYAYGIYSKSDNSPNVSHKSTINFNNGINTINADVYSTAASKAYGIYSDGDNNSLTVNFANPAASKVTIQAAASGNETDEQSGIYLNESSHLQRSGKDLEKNTTLDDMQQYVNFVGTGAGSAVDWIDHFTLDWPSIL